MKIFSLNACSKYCTSMSLQMVHILHISMVINITNVLASIYEE